MLIRYDVHAAIGKVEMAFEVDLAIGYLTHRDLVVLF